MKLKKLSSLVVLSAGILLLGGVNAKAESPYESIRGDIESNKSHVQSGVVDGFSNSRIDRLLKSNISQSQFNSLSKTQKSKDLLGNQKGLTRTQSFQSLLESGSAKNGYTTQELTGNTFYENEPNDSFFDADYLPQGDMVFGTFSQFDIDTYGIIVSQPSYIGVSGVMPTYSLSDIGFVLYDENGNLIYADDLQLGDHQWTAGYSLPGGVYYISAINIGEYVTYDAYALAWDVLDQEPPQDVTPPSAPQVNLVDDNDTLLSGTAEPNSTVEVSVNGTVVGTGVVKTNGQYEVYLPQAYPVGTIFNVTATDQVGNTSAPSNITVISSMHTGWVDNNGKRYYYKNGVKQIGWLLDNNKWYYLNNNTGAMQTGWTLYKNKWYFLNYQSGVMSVGWVLDAGKWYYLNNDGDMKTGWLLYGNKWYYLENNGAMKTGWLLYNGHWYLLNNNGDMATGWVNAGGKWYYLYNSGTMATGWVNTGGKWYYLYDNGIMAYNTKIGGYRLGADGAWIK